MRLRITNTNFTTKHDWLFKLADENGNDFYVMNKVFYEKHNLKSPITKKELDYIIKVLPPIISELRKTKVNN